MENVLYFNAASETPKVDMNIMLAPMLGALPKGEPSGGQSVPMALGFVCNET